MSGSARSAHWAEINDFGVVWGMRILVFLHRYVGRWVLPIILYPVVAYYLLVNGPARAASRAYLTRLKAFAPEVAVEPTLGFVFRHFLSFANATLDRIGAWTGVLDFTGVEFPHRREIEGQLNAGNGVMMVAAHLGCLEVCRALADRHQNIRLNILVHTKNARRINALLEPLNLHRQLELIEVTEVDPATSIRLSEKVARGEVVVVVGDRIPVRNTENTVICDFLGAPARFAQGPWILAHVLKCPIYTLFCIPIDGTYQIFCEPFADRVRLPRGRRGEELVRYVRAYAERLEYHCRMAPLQWFNFYPYWVSSPDDRE